MKFNQRINYAFLAVSLLASPLAFGQNSREMSIDDITKLALENHPQLKISQQSINIAKQQKNVAKLQQLPSIEASANAFYLGDALAINKDFSDTKTFTMPHFGNTFGVEAKELIFKGGLIKKSLEAADLKTQLAELDLNANQQNVKFLVISNYLDMMKLQSQQKVYENNRKLAAERVDNVKKFYKQGMITRNEVIRGELILKNLDQALLTISNNIDILNYNLDQALGLPVDTKIIPTEHVALLENEQLQHHFVDMAYENQPALKTATTNIEMAKKNLEIINTDKMPTLAAFGGYNMKRPIANSLPAIDMYLNTWQAGIALSYNIDNLYKTKEKLALGNLQKAQAEEALNYTKQNVEMAVNAAYTKYTEAIQNAKIQLESQKLAQENYKIIEAKYLNQLAVQVEMTDATNAKLESELNYVTAEINVMYQYYNLIKTTGTL